MNNIIRNPPVINGPNGIMLSFFLILKNNELGIAIKDAKARDINDINGLNSCPSTPINFISPPPNVLL